jgi:hypothetical protein
MKTPTIRFPLTFAAVMLATVVVAAALIGDINVIEVPFRLLDRIERPEVDEIVTSLFLIIAAFIVDFVSASRRARREVGLQEERLRVVQVTMRTVQDIVNNCLNQLQLVRFEAAEGRVSEEALTIFDAAIQETAAKLTALGDLHAYTERRMAMGLGLGE